MRDLLFLKVTEREPLCQHPLGRLTLASPHQLTLLLQLGCGFLSRVSVMQSIQWLYFLIYANLCSTVLTQTLFKCNISDLIKSSDFSFSKAKLLSIRQKTIRKGQTTITCAIRHTSGTVSS